MADWWHRESEETDNNPQKDISHVALPKDYLKLTHEQIDDIIFNFSGMRAANCVDAQKSVDSNLARQRYLFNMVTSKDRMRGYLDKIGYNISVDNPAASLKHCTYLQLLTTAELLRINLSDLYKRNKAFLNFVPDFAHEDSILREAGRLVRYFDQKDYDNNVSSFIKEIANVFDDINHDDEFKSKTIKERCLEIKKKIDCMFHNPEEFCIVSGNKKAIKVMELVRYIPDIISARLSDEYIANVNNRNLADIDKIKIEMGYVMPGTSEPNDIAGFKPKNEKEQAILTESPKASGMYVRKQVYPTELYSQALADVLSEIKAKEKNFFNSKVEIMTHGFDSIPVAIELCEDSELSYPEVREFFNKMQNSNGARDNELTEEYDFIMKDSRDLSFGRNETLNNFRTEISGLRYRLDINEIERLKPIESTAAEIKEKHEVDRSQNTDEDLPF